MSHTICAPEIFIQITQKFSVPFFVSSNNSFSSELIFRQRKGSKSSLTRQTLSLKFHMRSPLRKFPSPIHFLSTLLSLMEDEILWVILISRKMAKKSYSHAMLISWYVGLSCLVHLWDKDTSTMEDLGKEKSVRWHSDYAQITIHRLFLRDNDFPLRQMTMKTRDNSLPVIINEVTRYWIDVKHWSRPIILVNVAVFQH